MKNIIAAIAVLLFSVAVSAQTDTVAAKIDQNIKRRVGTDSITPEKINSVLKTINNRIKTTESLAVPNATKGQINGVTPLDNTGKVPITHIPVHSHDVSQVTNAASTTYADQKATAAKEKAIEVAGEIAQARLGDTAAAIRAKIKADSLVHANSLSYEQSQRKAADSTLNASKLPKSDTLKYVKYGLNAASKTIQIGDGFQGSNKLYMNSGGVSCGNGTDGAAVQGGFMRLQHNYPSPDVNGYNEVAVDAAIERPYPSLKLTKNDFTVEIANVEDSSTLWSQKSVTGDRDYINCLFSYQGDWYEQKTNGKKTKIIQNKKIIKDLISFDVQPDVVGFTDYTIALPYILEEDTYTVNASFAGGSYAVESPFIDSRGFINFRLRRHTDTSSDGVFTCNMKITVFRD